MGKSDVIRDAGLLNCSINGMPMAWFSETRGITTGHFTKCFKDEHEALLEIGIFKHGEIYKEMGKEAKKC